MFYLSTPYVNRHPQNHATWQNSKIRLIEYLQSRAPECRKIPSSTITAQVNTYNNQTIQLQVTFHTNQSPEFTILPIDLPENRWKPLDIPWSSNRFAWECPVYRLIAKTWADIAEKMAIRTMKQKGWEIFKPNCAPQSLELDHRSKKLKTANPLPFAPNLIPQYRDHLLAFQDCSFVTEAQYQFYAPMLNHLPVIVTKR